MSDDKRKAYWDESYLKYWQSRVGESNDLPDNQSAMIKQDVLTATDQNYADALDLLNLQNTDDVLEVGCGFGRSIPFIHPKSPHITAVDISEAMIEETQKRFGHLETVKCVVSEAETLPFASDTFTKIVCFSVFDALYQEKALVEFNRVCKKDALLVITGKNDFYYLDDDKAYVAEVNARAKGHPNYFSDLKKLSAAINAFGFELLQCRYFLRRGDTAVNQYVSTMPERFYEYTILLKKLHSPQNELPEFASKFSKTFTQKSGESL